MGWQWWGLALWLAAGGVQAEWLLGRVGAQPVAAWLKAEAGQVTGEYRYASQGQALALSGSLAADGQFVLQERAEGRETGRFVGRKQGAIWSGLWFAGPAAHPAAEAGLAFRLAPGEDLRPIRTQVNCAWSQRDSRFGYRYRHRLYLVLAAGRVQAFRAGLEVKGPDGDLQTCQLDLSDLHAVPTSQGLALATAAGPDSGCTVTVRGNADLLHIQMGSGAQGDDCRSAPDIMFCSPRAFWQDMVVQRKNGVCR